MKQIFNKNVLIEIKQCQKRENTLQIHTLSPYA
jgi:hypothetical protein